MRFSRRNHTHYSFRLDRAELLSLVRYEARSLLPDIQMEELINAIDRGQVRVSFLTHQYVDSAGREHPGPLDIEMESQDAIQLSFDIVDNSEDTTP